jgi:hypothetical protein
MKYLILNIILFASVGFFTVQLNTCGSCGYTKGQEEYLAIVNSLTSSNVNTEAKQKLKSYSFDKQVDAFLYAKNCAFDPRIEPYLMDNGEAILPDLLKRINNDSFAWNKVFLIQVVKMINLKCKCLKIDSEEMKNLESVRKSFDDDNQQMISREQYKPIFNNELDGLIRQINAQ